MFEKHIFCPGCGKTYKMDILFFRCEKCGRNLEIAFDYKKIKKNLSFFQRSFNHSRYLEFFPVKSIVSLQEGGTPLLRSRNLERVFNLDFELYFKYEAPNPTSSFKDRGTSVEVAKVQEIKQNNVICASTGNMGGSIAAYSAAAGLNCFIFTPRDIAMIKMEQILAYGAKVFYINAEYADVAEIVEKINKKGYAYLLGDYLYRREGTKSVGFEIAEQIGIFTTSNDPSKQSIQNMWNKNMKPDVPDYIFTPIGNGMLMSATWKAFKEFKEVGLLSNLPKMIGIQADGCAPVVNAFKDKTHKIKPIDNPHTIAVAVECGDPLDGPNALESVIESKGFCDYVTDGEILNARELLAKNEGLFAEPAGAVSLAGLLKFRDKIEKDSKVVCIVTGHGLKTTYTTNVKAKPKKIELDAVMKEFNL